MVSFEGIFSLRHETFVALRKNICGAKVSVINVFVIFLTEDRAMIHLWQLLCTFYAGNCWLWRNRNIFKWFDL